MKADFFIKELRKIWKCTDFVTVNVNGKKDICYKKYYNTRKSEISSETTAYVHMKERYKMTWN